MSDFVQQHHTVSDFTTSDSWVILSEIEQSIKRKIEAVGTPLKDWDIQINYGIKTGYNDAFIISSQKRDEILANCTTEEERTRTAELIRPILRGRDIKRYGYVFADYYLIATFPSRHYDIEDYPAVKKYLLSFGRERLEQTGRTYIVNGEKVKARKKTNNKWFETQDSISYWDDFSKPKIVYQELTQTGSFYLDDTAEFLISNTGYLMTGENLRYILGMLNSKCIEFCFKHFYSTSMGETGFRWLRQYIINLPIPKLSGETMSGIEEFVSYILEKNDANYLNLLDQKIYEIFKLTEDEINYINNN